MIRGQVFLCFSADKSDNKYGFICLCMCVCVWASCPQVLKSTAAVTAVRATATTGPQIIHGFWNKWRHRNGNMSITTQNRPSKDRQKHWQRELAIETNAVHRGSKLKTALSDKGKPIQANWEKQLLSISHPDKTNRCQMLELHDLERLDFWDINFSPEEGILGNEENLIKSCNDLKRHWWEWKM